MSHPQNDLTMIVEHTRHSKPNKKRTWPWVVGILVLLAGIIIPVTILVNQKPQPTTVATPTPQGVPTANGAPTANAVRTEFGAGIWIVPTEVEPGTYRTDGSNGHPRGHCYFARLNTLDTGPDGANVIADRLAEGPSIATVRSSDYAFETIGDCTWRKVN